MARFRLSKRNKSIVAGVACGLLCAACVAVYVLQVNEQAAASQAEMLARYGGDQIDVCVAKRDIMAGETISEGDIEVKTWIATLLPSNAVTDKRDAVGKQVGSTVLSGEVLSSSRFGFESDEIEVPEGMVAVSVPAREVQAVGGALAAGRETDVYAVGASETTKIASSVQVLATSAASDSTSSASAWVTLAVRPSMVQELVAAAQNMEIYFALPSASVSVGSEAASDSKVAGGGRSTNVEEADDSSASSSLHAGEHAGASGSSAGSSARNVANRED